MKSGAIIKGDAQEYRYALWRIWDETLPAVTWIMLNPSTADHVEDDPTIKSIIRKATGFGCGSVRVVNLFAYRTPSPDDLRKASKEGTDVIGPENDGYLRGILTRPGNRFVIAGWGGEGLLQARGQSVVGMCVAWGIDLYALKVSKTTFQPWHPLYIADDTVPELWKQANEQP